MNKRNIIFLLLASILFSLNANHVYAVNTIPPKTADIAVSVDDDDCIEDFDAVKRVSLREKFKKSPEGQINDFFKKHSKYTEKNNIAKLKELYSDNYVNNDGFNKATVFKMIEMASDTYKDVKYKTDIESIKVNGSYAIVKAHETAQGTTVNKVERVNDYGLITSDIYYTDYLRKEGNTWKLLVTDVSYEKVALRYGEAKNMIIDITAPEYVPAGTKYDVSINTASPDGVFMVGSIINEPIVFPQIQSKDTFKSIKSDEFTRILTANTDNNNEYATASIAITRAQIEPPSVILNMTGMAFVMKRINVIKPNDNLIKQGE